jgi:hypothetical protein
MKAVAFADGEQITHLRGERSWIEVSGFKGDRIFYRKAIVVCGGNSTAPSRATRSQWSSGRRASRLDTSGDATNLRNQIGEGGNKDGARRHP